MKFLRDIKLGMITYVDAVKFIIDHRLWLYFAFPLVLSGLILWGGYVLDFNLRNYQIKEASTLRGFIGEIFVMTLMATVVQMAFKLRKYLVFIVLSPLLTQLSQRTEELLTGNTYPFSFKQTLRDIRRAIRIVIGNFFWEYLILLCWYVLTLLMPFLYKFTPLFSFLLGGYFYGFSMIDYVCERHRLSIEESVGFARKHAGFAIANGLIFSAFFILPYDIGVLFGPVLGVVAACIGMHKLVDLNQSAHAVRKKSARMQGHTEATLE